VVASPVGEQVHRELLAAPAQYRWLLEAAPAAALRQRTAGTRWTNQEMLFHLLLGYLVVRTLRPLVWLMPRLPLGARRGFAAALDAGARPFHVVNYVGSVVGGHVLSLSAMGWLFERTCRVLARRVDRASDADLAGTMAFPARWDPFFTQRMSVVDIYHYPWQHYEFHRQQLTLEEARPTSNG
jgi:hypothetical protein